MDRLRTIKSNIFFIQNTLSGHVAFFRTMGFSRVFRGFFVSFGGFWWVYFAPSKTHQNP